MELIRGLYRLKKAVKEKVIEHLEKGQTISSALLSKSKMSMKSVKDAQKDVLR
jgi:hypothetical protein